MCICVFNNHIHTVKCWSCRKMGHTSWWASRIHLTPVVCLPWLHTWMEAPWGRHLSFIPCCFWTASKVFFTWRVLSGSEPPPHFFCVHSIQYGSSYMMTRRRALGWEGELDVVSLPWLALLVRWTWPFPSISIFPPSLGCCRPQCQWPMRELC